MDGMGASLTEPTGTKAGRAPRSVIGCRSVVGRVYDEIEEAFEAASDWVPSPGPASMNDLNSI